MEMSKDLQISIRGALGARTRTALAALDDIILSLGRDLICSATIENAAICYAKCKAFEKEFDDYIKAAEEPTTAATI